MFFDWGKWTRIDLRKPTTYPPVDVSVLTYIEGEGQVVAKFVGKRCWEKTKGKPTHYLYHNIHKTIKGHKVWWTYLPLDPKE